MGTNYYATEKACPTCKRRDNFHIGKSSAGWKFAFQINGEIYKSIEDFKNWLKGKKIEDEYNRKISHKDFWKMVDAKQAITDPEESRDVIIIDGYHFFDHEFS
jgi:hypothetical protein